jgi:hypothetical protein
MLRLPFRPNTASMRARHSQVEQNPQTKRSTLPKAQSLRRSARECASGIRQPVLRENESNLT